MFKPRWPGLIAVLTLLAVASRGTERINQEGRILGPVEVVTTPLSFNTPAADAVVAAMQILPVTHPWNEDIARRPRLANSDALIAQIMADLAPNRRTVRVFFEKNYALVPDNQPPVPITFFNYPDESDPSPYPIPAILPVETWPVGTGALTLQQWQQDTNGIGGDRHAIIVQPGTGLEWETWLMRLGTDGAWQASNGAKFDLQSNAQRPAGWTSGDAAGLAMFPALVRYDECERGMVEHAVRLVVKRSRREYIYPATHFASSTAATFTNVPAMGQRLRLKAGFNIPSIWTKQEQAVLKGLKKYGAMVADNGNFFSISATPDDRWPSGAFDHLSSVSITNFEVIHTTGPTEGPRSPGAPNANAGPNQTGVPGIPVNLQGSVGGTSTPTTVAWKVYSGPSGVVFTDSSGTNTPATFNSAGTYLLEMSADDGVHATSYSVATVTITAGLHATVARSGNTASLSWTGGAAPFVVERTLTLRPVSWIPALTTSVQTATFPISQAEEFFRVRQ